WSTLEPLLPSALSTVVPHLLSSTQDLYIPKLHIIQLEVVNEDSIANAVNQVSEIVGEKGLDILINNAGIGSDKPLNGD
ncbi:hypothetical protein PENTCL1PPCAC_1219, partial [Pristionchus entomophagus]